MFCVRLNWLIRKKVAVRVGIDEFSYSGVYRLVFRSYKYGGKLLTSSLRRQLVLNARSSRSETECGGIQFSPSSFPKLMRDIPQ